MVKMLNGVVSYKKNDAEHYIKRGWWRSKTLGDIFDEASDMHPEREAFVDQVSRYTYGEARGIVDRLALGLLGLGIMPMDRVLIQMPNWNEFIFAYFACQKIGAITVLLNDRYRPYEIDRILNSTGAVMWFVPKQTEKIEYFPIIDEVVKRNPGSLRVVTARGKIESEGFYSMDEILADSLPLLKRRGVLTRSRPDPMQVAHMAQTGGTTGHPKIVPRTHNSLICAVEYCSLAWDQHCHDVNLIAGPVGHDLSFSKGVLGSILTQGKIVFQESRESEDICKTIEREKVTATIWVPTFMERLLGYDGLDKHDLSSLKKMHLGGGGCRPDAIKEFLEKVNVCVYSGYGGTEGMTTITRDSDDCETVCSSVGKPTFPYDKYKIVDAEGKDLPLHHAGELLVKGPCIFSGYYNDPETNDLIFDDDGFFRTGDVAMMDSCGNIKLLGRNKEMINRGGESINVMQIENLIGLHPQIRGVAVVPVYDRMMGEKICACIEMKPNSMLTFDEVISFLKSKNVAVFHLPEYVEIIDKIPLTKTEKVDRMGLSRVMEERLCCVSGNANKDAVCN